MGLEISPDRLVQTLSAGERKLVEIAKALSCEPRLIIFDEPTTSLGERERERLFELITRLRERRITMTYISHTLADVFRLCDHIVILRDGEVVGLGGTREFDQERLITLMVGRPLTRLFPERENVGSRKFNRQETTPVLEARDILKPDVAENVSMAIYPGEVLGLAGLMGAGRSEFARILFGLDPRKGGKVLLDGKPLHRLSPRQLIQHGVGFLTENRHRDGLCLDASVAENFSLVTLPEHSRTPFRYLSQNSLRDAVTKMREVVRLDSKVSDTQPVRTLSGGNQQKIVLGKWLLLKPKVLILDEPTRGIDVGAKFEIYRLIYQLADNGTGMLVISSEMEELMGLCDRILLMRKGRLVDELSRAEFDRERILSTCLGRAKELASS